MLAHRGHAVCEHPEGDLLFIELLVSEFTEFKNEAYGYLCSLVWFLITL